MKHDDVKGYSVEELREKIGSEGEALRKLKFAHKVSAIENPMRIKETRKLIARLKTELNSKEKESQKN
jgi:large subunit ribosomal protein L29